jgi:hypothetical protein
MPIQPNQADLGIAMAVMATIAHPVSDAVSKYQSRDDPVARSAAPWPRRGKKIS